MTLWPYYEPINGQRFQSNSPSDFNRNGWNIRQPPFQTFWASPVQYNRFEYHPEAIPRWTLAYRATLTTQVTEPILWTKGPQGLSLPVILLLKNDDRGSTCLRFFNLFQEAKKISVTKNTDLSPAYSFENKLEHDSFSSSLCFSTPPEGCRALSRSDATVLAISKMKI